MQIGMGIGIGVGAYGGDADFLAWKAAVVDAGASISDESAANALFTSLKAPVDGTPVWDLITDLGIYMGVSTVAGTAKKAKTETGTGDIQWFNLVSGDLTVTGAGAGIKGDGSTKRGELANTRRAQGLRGHFAYITTANTASGIRAFLMSETSLSLPNDVCGLGRYKSGTQEIAVDSRSSSIPSNYAGPIVATRTGAYWGGIIGGQQVLYRNATLVGTAPIAGTPAASTVGYGILCARTPTGYSAASNATIGAHALTEPMTAAQAQALTNIINTYAAALGANVF